MFIHSQLPFFLKFIANIYSLIMRNLMSVGIQICIDLDYVLESKNGFNIQNMFKDSTIKLKKSNRKYVMILSFV